MTQCRTSFQPRLQLVTFGDSLTQHGSEPGGWVHLLGHWYTRKADVFNRGYSGFNTNHLIALLDQHIAHGIWPTNHAESKSDAPTKPTLLTLCIGANDSCLPDGPSAQQSVPLENYRSNLVELLTKLKGSNGKAAPDLHVILIGPPQCDAHMWGVVSKQRHNLAEIPITRDNNYTKQFSEAAQSVAKQFAIPFIDMYSLTSNWSEMLNDGLHFTEKGNYLLFDQVRSTIERSYPHLMTSALPVDAPPFQQITPRTLKETREFFQTKAEKKEEKAQS